MRRFLCLAIASGLGLVCADNVFAQAVQLPTFNYFTVDTTVSVPDGGGAYLGGVNRASSGSTTRGFGPLRNRAIGGSVGASNASVHATIIDHEELDREVLAEAARRRAARGDAGHPQAQQPLTPEQLRLATKANFIARHVAQREPETAPAPPTTSAPVDSIAAIRAQAQARATRLEAEAAEKLAAGMASEAAGKYASARGYYEAAIRTNVAGVKEEATRRLAKIALPKKSQRVAERP